MTPSSVRATPQVKLDAAHLRVRTRVPCLTRECPCVWQMVATPQYGYSEAPVPGGDQGRGTLYSNPGGLGNPPGGGGPYLSPPFYVGRSSGSPDRWDAVMDHSYDGAPMRIRIL